MSAPNKPAPGSREVRLWAGGLRVERRAEGDPPTIVGHAAVFDEWTTLYEGRYYLWREVVRPGAFRNALAEKQDVRALFNHDPNHVLGRTASGTLDLIEDARGLLSTIRPPDTQAGRDVLTLVERGDVSGMSFGFIVRASGERSTITRAGEREQEDRELLDLDLTDVSVVTYPAYPQTDVAIRSRCEGLDLPRTSGPSLRARARLRLAETLAKTRAS